LNKGEDLHSFVGSLMFGKTITKEMPERNEAKSINFGKPYGMGPNKLAAELQISLEKSNELFKTYARLFPNLDRWLTKQGNFAKVNGYAKTFAPCKRKRYFPDVLEAK